MPDAAALLAEIEREAAEGYVAAHATTTMYNIVAKSQRARSCSDGDKRPIATSQRRAH
jgi:hypothetical protein